MLKIPVEVNMEAFRKSRLLGAWSAIQELEREYGMDFTHEQLTEFEEFLLHSHRAEEIIQQSEQKGVPLQVACDGQRIVLL